MRRNGYQKYIEVIEGKVEDIEIPEKVDVVIRSVQSSQLLVHNSLCCYGHLY